MMVIVAVTRSGPDERVTVFEDRVSNVLGDVCHFVVQALFQFNEDFNTVRREVR